MAAALSVLMTIIIWFTAILGGLLMVFCLIGIVTEATGAAVPLISASLEDSLTLHDLIFVFASMAIVVPGIVYVALNLRRILTTLAEGDPFVPENANRLSKIAFVLAGMEIAAIVLIILARMVFVPSDVLSDVQIRFDLIMWAAVAALLILSQVFREGTRLRDEEKMTV